MPTCAKCNKKTFDGTRWNSTLVRKEFNGKYLCRSCHQETQREQTEYNQALNNQIQEHQIEKQKELLNAEIEATKNKLVTLESMKANNTYSGDQVIPKSNENVTAEKYLGTVSIVIGIISFLILGILFSAIAIAIGYLAFRQNDRKGVIGIVIGVLALLLSLMVLLGSNMHI